VKPGHSPFERFQIPYTFKPNLSVSEAVAAAAVALLRIFLGSLLFAFWGAYSLAVVTKIQSWFWRAALAVPLIILFVLLFALLMLAITALGRRLVSKAQTPS
jgi:hypothetical protein